MEGDIITLQDLFLFDYSAGFDERRRARSARCKSTGLRPKFIDKLAAARRHHRPATLHAGRSTCDDPPAPSTPRGRRRGRPRGLPHAGWRRRDAADAPAAGIDHVQNAGDHVQALFSVPRPARATSRPTRRRCRSPIDGAPIDGDRRASVDAGTIVRAHADPGDRRQPEHGRHAVRRGEAGARSPTSTPLRRRLRRPRHVRRAPSRPSQAPTQNHDRADRRRSTASTLTPSGPRLYDGVLRRARRCRHRRARARCCCCPTATTTPARSRPRRASSSARRSPASAIDAVGLDQQRPPAAAHQIVDRRREGTVTSTSDVEPSCARCSRPRRPTSPSRSS